MQPMRRVTGSKIAALCLVVLTCVFLLHLTLRSSSITYSSNDHQAQEMLNLKPRKLITCDRSHKSYDLCYLNHSTLIDPKTSTLSSVSPPYLTSRQTEKIRPYPRKWQNLLMSSIKELTLDTSSVPDNTTCAITHNVPALVFSAGGYTGNFFHDFYDGLIPLFITVNSIFPEQDIILVVVNCKDKWLIKYGDFLRHFSSHPVINLDSEKLVHCFPSANVGLISHGQMIIDPNLFPPPHPKKTLLDFHALLKTTYSQGETLSFSSEAKIHPRLVLVNRQGNRRILNKDEIRQAAEDVGFNVVVFEPNQETTLSEAYRVFESSHAMIGVHGAGLTHELFLKPGSSFIQIVPIGFNWLAEICFENMASRLGLKYIEYDIAVNESSLVEKYGEDSVELNNPGGIVRGEFTNMGIYVTQDVKLDVTRFKGYLSKSYESAKRFMLRESLNLE